MALSESIFQVRGVLYAAVRGWIRENFSNERYLDFLGNLPKNLYERMVIFEAEEWYPAQDVYPVYEYLIEYLRPEMSEAEIIKDIVGYMFKKSVTGFLRTLVAFLSPSNLIKRATSFWLQVHSQGRIETEKIRDKYLIVQLHEWKAHRISCLIFERWMCELLHLAGGINILTKKVGCALKGDDACRWEVIYE
ncbi:hypothetical protein GF359_03310 [candidate division WOR-3 bacterium]|uniref:4-vinyl reductase 4VR domain-containing protein n=1 Tax=candidate division WOR-3 bacterium TaxID=2052148 RepID=A0A9D5K8F2_UNCW3|nr:hypothetical protein [candidate division WOR-3 bacterium]MBD3364223.1 hypothetical protein [candidate division WOR-3 bacterium]